MKEYVFVWQVYKDKKKVKMFVYSSSSTSWIIQWLHGILQSAACTQPIDAYSRALWEPSILPTIYSPRPDIQVCSL